MAKSFTPSGPDQITTAIRTATTLEQIQEAVGQLPAKAKGPDAVLYSGRIGEVRSESVAQELAKHGDLSIINDTPRARFLADKGNEDLIKSRAADILEKSGRPPAEAAKMSVDFLYGNGTQPSHSPTSVEGCLWGKASKEFAESLAGSVKVVATAASADRVFGRVEIPAALSNQQIPTLASIPMDQLRETHQKQGVEGVLSEVQKPCVQAVQKGGIYAAPDSSTGIALSKEFAESMGVRGRTLSDASTLAASGLKPASTGVAPAPDAPSKTSSSDTAMRRVEQLLSAMRTGDDTAVRKETQQLASSDSARQMQAQAISTVDRQEQAQKAPQPSPAQPSGQQQGQPDPNLVPRARL